MDIWYVNDRPLQLQRLLGKGKGGYSYLVTGGGQQYVLKQIHHEPCAYYQFGDKLASEVRDYGRLKAVGIPTVEVHVSDPDSREDFRHTSYIRAACAGTINAGVPPPKYSVSGRRVFFASSRSSAST